METQSLIERIKSKVTLGCIFSFIREKKKYQLIVHTKKLQDIFNINLQNYKTKCFELFSDIDFLSSLSTDYLKYTFINDAVDYKTILKKNYEEELEKHNLQNIKYGKRIELYFEYFCNEIYNNHKSKEEINKKILDTHLIMDIYSPFYEVIMKKDIFEKLFVLKIPFDFIFKKQLMDDYFNAIDSLSKINPNFSSLYIEISDLWSQNQLYVKKIFDCFSMIKKLIIKFPRSLNTYIFPKEIFEYSNIKNNLLYLEFKSNYFFNEMKKIEIAFEKLKNLEELRVNGITNFDFGKNNIKYLDLSDCSHFSFTENCYPNLQTINLFNVESINEYHENSQKIKLPELIKFRTSFCFQHYGDVFDFNSCTKLKYFIRLNSHDFLQLGETSLEKLYIKNQFTEKEEIKMLKKIMEIKTLKELKIDLLFLSENSIKQIKGEN